METITFLLICFVIVIADPVGKNSDKNVCLFKTFNENH